MLLYDSIGPNPRVVRMYLHERNLDVPRVAVDVLGAENRREPFLTVNPAATVPALQLDDGSVLSESTVICEYLEDLGPPSGLLGTDAKTRALVRMWVRLITLRICEPMTYGFRFGEGLALFESRVRCLPESSEGFKAIARDGIEWLDRQMAGREYLTGGPMSLADIVLYSHLHFFSLVNQPVAAARRNVLAWFARVGQRPSALATAYTLPG